MDLLGRMWEVGLLLHLGPRGLGSSGTFCLMSGAGCKRNPRRRSVLEEFILLDWTGCRGRCLCRRSRHIRREPFQWLVLSDGLGCRTFGLIGNKDIACFCAGMDRNRGNGWRTQRRRGQPRNIPRRLEWTLTLQRSGNATGRSSGGWCRVD